MALKVHFSEMNHVPQFLLHDPITPLFIEILRKETNRKASVYLDLVGNSGLTSIQDRAGNISRGKVNLPVLEFRKVFP